MAHVFPLDCATVLQAGLEMTVQKVLLSVYTLDGVKSISENTFKSTPTHFLESS